MSTHDEEFGRLRGLMNRRFWGKAEYHQLRMLVERSFKRDRAHYRQVWLPYMQGFPQHFNGFPCLMNDLDDYRWVSRMFPHATFSLKLMHPKMVDHFLTTLGSPSLRRISTLYVQYAGDEFCERLAEASHLNALRSLRISSPPPKDKRLSAQGLHTLAHSDVGQDLEHIELRGIPLGRDRLRVLGTDFEKLERLHCTSASIDSDVVSELVSQGLPEQLKVLDLSSNHLGTEGVRALCAGHAFTSLLKLNLSGNQLDAEAIDVWVKQSGHTQLESLCLNSNQIGDEGIHTLAESPTTHALKTLKVGFNAVTQASCKALMHAPCFPNLRTLDWAASQLGHVPPQELAQGFEGGHFEHLHLSMNALHDEHIHALVHTAGCTLSGTLDLSSNTLTHKSMATLASSPKVEYLSVLMVGENQLGDQGVSYLMNSEHMARLEELALGDVGCRSAGAKSIAQSPYVAQLRTLSLMQNTIGDAGAKAIAKSALFTHLEELHLDHRTCGKPGFNAIVNSAHLPESITRHYVRYM